MTLLASLTLAITATTATATTSTTTAPNLAADTITATAASSDPLALVPKLEWNEDWPRFRTEEYIATGALLIVNTFGSYIVPAPPNVRWYGGVLFDESLQTEVRKISGPARHRFKVVGDYMFPALTVMPIVLDSMIVAWWVHGSFDVAWETALISLQSLLVSSITNLIFKRLTARTRPGVLVCEANGTGRGDPSCGGGGGIRSFYSGHAGMAATGAGLMCVVHEYLDLFGGGWADHLTCAGAISGAVFVAVSRLINDAHYATDSIAGLAIGLGYGVLLPVALHYGYENGVHVMPAVGEDSMSISVGGTF